MNHSINYNYSASFKNHHYIISTSSYSKAQGGDKDLTKNAALRCLKGVENFSVLDSQLRNPVLIVVNEDGSCTAKTASKTLDISAEELVDFTEDEGEWKIKEIPFKDVKIRIALPEQQKVLKNWKRFYGDLLQKIPKKLFLPTLLSPFLWVYGKLVYKKSPLDTSKEEAADRLNFLIQSKLPANPEDLISILSHQLRYVPKESKESPILETTIANNREIQTAIKTGRLEETLSRISRTLSIGHPLVITSGVYTDEGSFCPVIYTFTKDENGAISLSSWEVNHDSNHSSITEWNLPSEGDQAENVLIKAINLAVLHSATKKTSIEDSKIAQVEVFRNLANKLPDFSRTDELGEKAAASINRLEGVKAQLEQLGAQRIESQDKQKVKFKDGLELCWSVINTFSDRRSADKIQILIHVIDDQVDALVQGLDHLSPSEKLRALRDIDSRLVKLKARMAKALGGDRALELLLETHSFSNFKATLENLEKVRGDIHHRELEGPKNLLSLQNFEALKLGKSQLSDSMPLSQEDFWTTYFPELEKLSKAFANKETKDIAYGLYEELAARVDTLVANNKYEEANTLAVALQERLPTPGGHDFWEDIFSIDSSIQEMEKWSVLVEKTSHLHWESFTRLQKDHVNPDELVGMMNSRACLIRLMELKRGALSSRLSDTLRDEMTSLEEDNDESIDAWRAKVKSVISRLKSEGFSYEEASLLLFENYEFDNSQLLNFLKHHPHLRVNAFPESAAKAKRLERFFDSLPEARLVSLTSRVELPDHYADDNYIYQLEALGKVFHKNQTSRKNILQEFSHAKTQLLPMELVNLRRHSTMTHMMLRPESSLALHFKSPLKAINWMSKLHKKAVEETKDEPSQTEKKVQDLAYQELNQVLSKEMIGRLDIAGNSYFNDQSTSAIVSSESHVKVNFLPWGLGVSYFEKRGNDDQTASELAPVPEKYLGNISDKDKKSLHKTSDPTAMQEVTGFTEEGHLKLSLVEQADIGAVEDYLLRTLGVASENQMSSGESHIIEALHLLCVRPSLLSHPDVRGLMDLIFTRYGAFSELLKVENQAILINFNQQLKTVITEQVHAGQVDQAAYLMHLGRAMQTHIGKKGFVGKEMEDVFDSCQDYDKEYQVVGKDGNLIQMTGFDYLRGVEAAGQHDVSQYLMENFMSLYSDERKITRWIQNAVDAADGKTVVDFFNTFDKFQRQSPTLTTPFVHQGILKWATEIIHPQLMNMLEKEEVLRNAVLAQIVGTEGKFEWERIPDTMIYKGGKYEVNLLNRAVKINGVAVELENARLSIPKLAFERFPELVDLMESSSDFKSRQGSQGEMVFSFISKEGVSYQLSYFKSSAQVILNADFTKSGFSERYQKIYPEAPAVAGFPLVNEFGLWVNLKDPTQAFVSLDNIPHQFPFNQMEVEMSAEGEFKGGVVTIDNQRYPIDFSSSQYHVDFPFASSEECFFIPDTQELVFFYQGMMAKKEGQVWKIQQPKSLENLTVQKPDQENYSDRSKRANQLMKALGPEFGMRLHSDSKDRIFLCPKSVSRNSQGEIRIFSEAPNLPYIEINFSKDGKIEASSGGFMYMAYALMQKREYQLANTMLTLAKQARIESTHDQQIFRHVAELIRRETPMTTRSIAFQLTAEVALIEIEKQQLSQSAYDPRYRLNYFENIQRLSNLFGQYTVRLASQKKETSESFKTLLEEHELTTPVIQQCENFRREAFADLIYENSFMIDTSLDPFSSFLKTVSDKDFTAEVISQIATYTVLPSDKEIKKDRISGDLKALLMSPGVLTSEHVLKYFCIYYNEIIKGNLALKDLECLFHPLSELVDKSLLTSQQQKVMVHAADTARRMLIQAAMGLHYGGEQAKNLSSESPVKLDIDLKRLQQLKKDIPKEIFQPTVGNLLKLNLQAAWERKSLGKEFRERTKELVDRNPHVEDFLTTIFAPIERGVLRVFAIGIAITEDVDIIQGDFLTPTGVIKSLVQKNKDIPTDSIHIESALENIEEIVVKLGLSDLESMSIKEFLEACKGKTIEEVIDGKTVQKPLEFIPLAQLISFIDTLGVSLIDIRKEQNLRNQIDLLEKELLLVKDRSSDYSSSVLSTSLITYSQIFAIENFFDEPPPESEEVVQKTFQQLEATFDVNDATLSLAEKEEFANMKKGLDDVMVKRIDPEAQMNRLLTLQGKVELENLLAKELDSSVKESAAQQYEALKAELLTLAKGCGIPSIAKLTENSLINSSEDILNELLQTYQFGHPKLAGYEKAITSFLLWGTTVQQLGNAQGQLNKINNCWDLETRREESRKLCHILDHNLQITRYGTSLKEPETYRKFLVAEYRMGIVLQKGQLDTILKISENPHAFYSLRMGEGKTFLIMPIVAAFLAERGTLPIMLVPPQLESLNQSDFDRTTNKVMGRRAYAFRVELNNTHSGAYLADLYHHLLLARKTKDYITSSVPALASLKSLFVQLRDERTALLSTMRKAAKEKEESVSEFVKDPQNIAISTQYLELNNRLHWIRKIELQLDGKLELMGSEGKSIVSMPTHLFGDEVDSIYSITDEITRASGNTVSVSSEIKATCSSIFQTLLHLPENLEEYSSEEVLNLKTFQKALLNGNLTILKGELSDKEFKDTYLKPLAKLLLAHPEFNHFLPDEVKTSLSTIKEEVADYLVGISSTKPRSIQWDDNANPEALTKLKMLAAAKHLLSFTFSSLCQVESGLGFILDSEKGCLAVPSKNGREIVGNRYSDEYDLIAFQYLAHIQVNKTQGKHGETLAFYTESLKKLHEINPHSFETMKERVEIDPELKGQVLYEAFAKEVIVKPELWKERLTLVDRFVFDGGMIQRSEEKIPVQAQSVVNGPGGVTGTLNAFSLPGFRPSDEVDKPSTRQVEAETFFKAAVNNSQGLFEEVHPINDTDPRAFAENFREMINSSTTVAIVNEGGYGLEGQSIKSWVTQLRGLFEKGNERDLVWFDETPNQGTKYYLWEKDQTSFREIIRNELDARTDPFIGIYPPQFTRGADLPLGTGDIHYLPSRSTNPQDAGQSIWRGRGTGNRHTTKFHMPQSVMGKETWTIGDTYQWMIKRGVQEQLVLNMMAQDFRITDVAPSELRRFFSSFTAEELMGTFSSLTAESLETTYALTLAEDQLSQLFREYFVKKNEVDFESDLEPTKTEEIQSVMNKKYDREIEKIEAKKDLLPQELLQVARNLIQDSNSQDKMTEVSSKIVSDVLSSLKNDQVNLKVFIKAFCGKDEKIRSAVQDLVTLVEAGSASFDTTDEKKAADEAFVMIIGYVFTHDLLDAYSHSEISGSEEEKFFRSFELSREKLAERLFQAGLKSKAKQGELSAKFYSTSAGKMTVKAAVSTLNFFSGLKDKFLKPSQTVSNYVATPEESSKKVILDRLPELSELPPAVNSVLFRFSQAAGKLTDISRRLEEDKNEFNAKFSEYQKYLPEQAASSTSTSGKLEQQQQQQQQQTIVQSKTSEAKEKDMEFSRSLKGSYAKPYYLQSIPEESSVTFKISDWEIADVWMTIEAKKILELMPRMSGDPWCKICVNPSGQVLLVSKQDYHLFKNSEDAIDLKIFAPVQKGNVVLKGDGALTDKEIKRVAVLKLRLGFTDFSQEEWKQLKIWWKDLQSEDRSRLSGILEGNGFNIELLKR